MVEDTPVLRTAKMQLFRDLKNTQEPTKKDKFKTGQ